MRLLWTILLFGVGCARWPYYRDATPDQRMSGHFKIDAEYNQSQRCREGIARSSQFIGQ